MAAKSSAAVELSIGGEKTSAEVHFEGDGDGDENDPHCFLACRWGPARMFSWQFGVTILLIKILLIILYSQVCDYPSKSAVGLTATSQDTVLLHYGKFQDVHVMIFIGFGFLMTFLKRYGFSAVGFNFLLSAMTIQWALVNNGFWHQMFHGDGETWHVIEIDIISIIAGDFAAGAVMITLGAVLGKISPLEMLLVIFVEMIGYAINENIGNQKLKAVDMGGSMYVHAFGAYFGLALSYMVTPKKKFEEKDEGSVYHSDMFAMIGTIFLWMFWPSFNGALASGDQQHRVIINTVITLTASCVVTFAMSGILRHGHKFDMVDIQNATLAGGVAVGSASDLVIEPWAAILIGLVAGMLSVVGYTKLQPWLQGSKKSGGCAFIHDTCGVHNLHGMPGILGGVCGAISAAIAGDSAYGAHISTIWIARAASDENRTAREQGGYQILAVVCSVGIAIFAGLIAGAIINIMRRCCCDGPKHFFHDGDYWEEVTELDGAPKDLFFEEDPRRDRDDLEARIHDLEAFCNSLIDEHGKAEAGEKKGQ